MSKQSVIFNGEINHDNVSEFIDSMDTVLNKSTDDIDVYFSSNGGDLDYMRVMTSYFKDMDLFNKTSGKKILVTIKAFGHVSSTAFEFLVKAENCNKYILEDTYSILHAYTGLYDYRVNILNSKTPVSLKVIEKINENLSDFLYTCSVPEDKIIEISKGSDVSIGAEEIRKCIDEWRKKNKIQ